MNNKLRMPLSEYSQMYAKYMAEEFPTVEPMVRKMMKTSVCKEYALKFPLEGLLKGAVKRMQLNSYELVVLGMFL
jgi:hypothetical protein